MSVPAFYQQKVASSASASSLAANFTNAQANGNANIVFLHLSDTGSQFSPPVSNVSDSSGNIYKLLGSVFNSGDTCTITAYGCSSIRPAAAGSNTVTINLGGTHGFCEMVVLEIAGQTIIDTVQPYTSASASNPSVSVVTAGVQENIIAYLRSTGGTFSATSPAVAITTLPYSSYLEYQLALSPGSQTVGFTATTGKVSILAVALANTNPNSSTVNVRSFGSAGDGITDDTNSIQLALNAALSGDTVYFP